eukprot:4451457-Pyramimonas_sp.AAC.1
MDMVSLFRIWVTYQWMSSPHRFGNSLEAFQYIQRHEEEHHARGFTSVFCKSLGGVDAQDAYEQPQPCAKIEEPSPLWLSQADPAPVHQPVQHTRAVLNGEQVTHWGITEMRTLMPTSNIKGSHVAP